MYTWLQTLILPTQDNGWLSVPPTEPCNYQHKQQQNFINKQIKLQRYIYPQLARIFEAGQCVHNIYNITIQQRPDSAQWLGQIKKKVLASQRL